MLGESNTFAGDIVLDGDDLPDLRFRVVCLRDALLASLDSGRIEEDESELLASFVVEHLNRALLDSAACDQEYRDEVGLAA